MEREILGIYDKYINEKLKQIVISGGTKQDGPKKITVRPATVKGVVCYQAAEYCGTQVFHQNYDKQELLRLLLAWSKGLWKQIQIVSEMGGADILVSRKGNVRIQEKPAVFAGGREADPGVLPSHNRAKNYIIKEGSAVPFLVDLGVMTKEGKIIQAKYDKFRQINRFLEFIDDIEGFLPEGEELHILDFGCGKSYLTFAMYYYFVHIKNRPVRITGLDLKADVIEACGRLQVKYGYEGLHFQCGEIADYRAGAKIDMVVTLHACDTATDYALYKASEWGAAVILSVPCCHHEVNRQTGADKMRPILKHGLIRERISALITDSIRAECLEVRGYKTQIAEFIDMEHTPKNILIRAVRRQKPQPAAITREKERQLAAYLKEMGITQKLAGLFGIGGSLPDLTGRNKEFVFDGAFRERGAE